MQKRIDGDPLVSVIVPIYNVEKYLSRCLSSILNNSYHNLEVICVNDGSTDNSLKLLQEFEKKDNRVVLVDQPNGGVSSARNKGLEIATGEYISFVDADDWIHRDFFRIMMDAIGETDIVHCELLRCDNELTDQEIGSINTHVYNASEGSLIPLMTGTSCCMVFKRSVIDTVRFPYGIRYGEDKCFVFYVLCNAKSITMLDCSLYYYYTNYGSATFSYSSDMYPFCLELLKLAKHVNDSAILHEVYKDLLACRYLNMFHKDAKGICKKCNQSLKECRNFAKTIMPW